MTVPFARAGRPTWRNPWRRFRPRTRVGAAVLAAAVLFVLWLAFGRDGVHVWQRDEILAAIRFVESSNRDDVPDGDGGRAIGPYQIHREYWQDAVAFEPSLGGGYQDCRQRDYAERVIAAYMRRYVPAAWQGGDGETIARVHNGGPRGHKSSTTERYWQRVRGRLR